MRGQVAIISENYHGYRVNNTNNRHSWNSDEPVSEGGLDEGPSPVELFLSSLASCKLITMRMYAERKLWDFQGAKIQLTLFRGATERFIEKRIELKGDLTEDQKKRLIEISGRCPVVKLVDPSIEFRTIPFE